MSNLDIGKMPDGSLLIRDFNNHTWPGLMIYPEAQRELLNYLLKDKED